MPAKDVYHDIFVRSLLKEEWKITHDPLILSYGSRDLYVDLGAERAVIAAERDEEKIAVESVRPLSVIWKRLWGSTVSIGVF